MTVHYIKVGSISFQYMSPGYYVALTWDSVNNYGVFNRLDVDLDTGAWEISSSEILTSTTGALKSEAFNFINASDIVSNTLTQAQYDLITNGKPTFISGGLFSIPNVWLFFQAETSSFFNFIYFGDEVGIIQLNKNSKILSKESATYQAYNIRSVKNFNGKAIPPYPANTGTFTLKCVNGTLTWVAD